METNAVYFCDVKAEIVTLKGIKRYFVAGMISTTDKDLADDVLTKSAQKDLYDQIQDRINKGGYVTGDIEHMVFYDDDGNQLDTPKVRDERGNLIIPETKFVEAELRDNGVWAKAEINQHIPNFKSIWKSIQDGFLNAYSVAVKPIAVITKIIDGVATNFVSKLKLINITLTGSPCNQNATMGPVLKSFLKDIDNSNQKLQIGDSMEKYTKKIYDSLSEDDKAKYDALESIELKSEFIKGFEESDSQVVQSNEPTDEKKPVDPVEPVEPVEPVDNKAELKSMEASLKTALKAIIEEKTIGLKTELKSLNDRVEKMESKPIKKSIRADTSVMLGKSDEFNIENVSAMDLIK